MIAVVTARAREPNTFIGICCAAEGQFCFPLDDDKVCPSCIEVRFYPPPPENAPFIGVLVGFAMQADEYVVTDFLGLHYLQSADEASEIASGKYGDKYDVGVGVMLYTASGRYLMTVYDRGVDIPDYNRDDTPAEMEGWHRNPVAALHNLLSS